jgi:hypothetical protein
MHIVPPALPSYLLSLAQMSKSRKKSQESRARQIPSAHPCPCIASSPLPLGFLGPSFGAGGFDVCGSGPAATQAVGTLDWPVSACAVPGDVGIRDERCKVIADHSIVCPRVNLVFFSSAIGCCEARFFVLFLLLPLLCVGGDCVFKLHSWGSGEWYVRSIGPDIWLMPCRAVSAVDHCSSLSS